jgi:hypothetical protein
VTVTSELNVLAIDGELMEIVFEVVLRKWLFLSKFWPLFDENSSFQKFKKLRIC